MTTPRLTRALQRHLIAGLIVIAPVGVTAAVLIWIFGWVDGLLGRFFYPLLPFPIPGLGLLALLLLLVVVGWAAQRAVGARILGWWHALLERLPLTRSVYSASSRIVRVIFGESKQRPFKDVVLVPFPAEGRWSIGFVTGTSPTAMAGAVQDGVSVFVPTTPNPTTGFLITIERSELVPIDMTTEQAFTFILSAGSVAPDAMVDAARLRAAALESR